MMKRSDLIQELEIVRKWTEGLYSQEERKDAEAAEKRILNAFDDLWRELGYVGALRKSLDEAVSAQVRAEVRCMELERAIALLRKPNETEEGDDD
jgi:RNA polymerase-interacting CarD/CdnL/TRCF family regulator